MLKLFKNNNSFIFDANLITVKGDVTISCEIVALWEFFF